MRFLSSLFILAAFLYACPANSQFQRSLLKRKDSFFGIHFDFHAARSDSALGKMLTPEMIDSLLTIVKPDFVQVDCKGHPGVSSYPTKIGSPASDFVKDPLRIWRDVTAKHGVALYVHYSGVFDQEAVRHHPEWAAKNEKGMPDSSKISVHSQYAQELLIPQLKELSRDYQINGVWVDGDCWAMIPDYSETSLQQFHLQTGNDQTPRAASDPGYLNFMDFNRSSFITYLRQYTRALHQFNPDFQIASNWAFSSFMPEPVSVDLDFLSGDLAPNNSVSSAAFEARCLSTQGRTFNKPWDLMSWSFTLDWKRPSLETQKSLTQITQEASEVIAMGGAFQSYFTQNRDASIKTWQISLMKGLGDFLRPRQPFCKGAVPVPQIALLYSGEAHKRTTEMVYFNDTLDAMRGILDAVLDGQQAVEIIMEHHLKDNIQRYPLIIIPEWEYLPAAITESLLQYADKGGNLLVIGAKACRLFEKQAGAIFQNEPVFAVKHLGFNGKMAAMEGRVQYAQLQKGVKAIGGIYNEYDLSFPFTPAAAVSSYGKGKIACLFTDFGANYRNNESPVQRDFLQALIKEVFPSPMVEVRGSRLVHVTVNKLDGKTIVHLINSGGQHKNKTVYAYDETPPVGPLTISIRTAKPKRIMLEPRHSPLPFVYRNGVATVQLPSLAIHQMLILE